MTLKFTIAKFKVKFRMLTCAIHVSSQVLAVEYPCMHKACTILVACPFNRYSAMTSALSYDAIQGQFSCQVGGRNSLNLLIQKIRP